MGFTYDSPFINLSEAFAFLNSSIQNIFLMNSSVPYLIDGRWTLEYPIKIQSFFAAKTVIIFKANLQLEIKSNVEFDNLIMNFDEQLSSEYIFLMRESSSLILQNINFRNLKDAEGFKGLLLGKNCKVLINNSDFSSILINQKINSLFYVTDKSEIIVKNSFFHNIVISASIFFKIYGLDSYGEIFNSSFSQLSLNFDMYYNQPGSLFMMNSERFLAEKNSFVAVGLGYGSFFYIQDYYTLHTLEINNCIFKYNIGLSTGLVFKSNDNFYDLHMRDVIFIENIIESDQDGGIIINYAWRNPSKIILEKVYAKGNFGKFLDSDQSRNITICQVYLLENNVRGNIISQRGRYSIRIHGTEKTSINGLFIIDSISVKEVAGIKFHLFSYYYYDQYTSEFREKVQRGEKVIANFTNVIFINLTSTNVGFDRGSGIHFVVQAPLIAKFKNCIFMDLKNNMGSPCIDIWCDGVPFPEIIIYKSLFFKNTYVGRGSNCIGANKVKISFIETKFINNTCLERKFVPENYGVISIDASHCLISDSYFEGNQGFETGIFYLTNSYLDNMKFLVTNSTFIKNLANLAGVFQISNCQSNVLVYFLNSSFIENSAITIAGVFYFNLNIMKSIIHLENNYFYKNNANKGAVIFFQIEKMNATLSTNIFKQNAGIIGALNTIPFGGVMYILNTDMSLIIGFKNIYIENNSSFSGGVYVLISGSLNESFSFFSKNTANDNSGVINLRSMAVFSLNDCIIERTSSMGSGGILIAYEMSSISIFRSFFLSNYAYFRRGNFLLNNVTSFVAMNSYFLDASADEGGLLFGFYLNLEFNFENCSFIDMSFQKSIFNIFSSNLLIFKGITITKMNCSFIFISNVNLLIITNSMFRDLECFEGSKGCSIFGQESMVLLNNTYFKGLKIAASKNLIYLLSSQFSIMNAFTTNLSGDSKGVFLSSLNCSGNIINSTFQSVVYSVFYFIESKALLENCYFDNVNPDILEKMETNSYLDQSNFAHFLNDKNSSIFKTTILGSAEKIATLGGAILISREDDLKEFCFNIILSLFYMCNVKLNGGAIYIDKQNIYISTSFFIKNEAAIGAAISYSNPNEYNSSQIILNHFLDNVAQDKGGCMDFESSIPFLLNNSFQNNKAFYGSELSAFPHHFNIKFFQKENFTDIGNSPSIIEDFTHIFEISSGSFLEYLINIEIMDPFGQKIITMGSGAGKIAVLPSSPPPKEKSIVNYTFAQPLLLGTLQQQTKNGSFLFSSLKAIATPNSFITLFISHDALSNSVMEMDDSAFSSYSVVNSQFGKKIEIKIKPCQSGEIYISNSNICEACIEGKYSFVPSDLVCRNCPKNAFCPGKNVIDLEQGFWKTSNISHLVFSCFLNQHACRGGKDSACKEGYEGPLCSVCTRGEDKIYTKMGLYCLECLGTFWNGILIFCVGMGLMGFVGVLVRTALKVNVNNFVSFDSDSGKSPSSSLFLKILLDHLQLLAITQSIPTNAPDIFKQLSSTQSNVVLFPTQIFSFDCFIRFKNNSNEPTFFIKILFTAILPFVFLLGNVVFWMGLFFKDKKDKNQIIKKFYASVLVSLFFLHPIIINGMVKIFGCFEIEDTYYMIVDMNFECFTEDHYLFIYAFAIPYLCFFSIIYPCFCYYRIYRNKTMIKDYDTIMKYGFFYDGYNARLLYWGLAKMIQKTIFIVLTNSLLDFKLQIILIIFIITINLSLESFRKMYVHFSLNNLNFTSSIVALMSLMINLFNFMEGGNFAELFCFIIFIVGNFLFLMYWCSMIIKYKYSIFSKIFKTYAGKVAKKSNVFPIHFHNKRAESENENMVNV